MAIQIQAQDGAKLLVMRSNSATLSETDAREILNTLKRATEFPALIVLDFSTVDDVAVPALRTLTLAASLATQKDAKLCLVAQLKFAKRVEEQGLERLLVCYDSIRGLITDRTPAKPTGNNAAEFLKTVLGAIQYTFEVTANTKLTGHKTGIAVGSERENAEVGAAVGIVSRPFTGSLILAFPQSTFLTLMSRMMGQSFTEISPEIKDGAAEILNIILGQAKTTLNEKGFAIKPAIPVVIRGKQLQMYPSNSNQSHIISYKSDAGEFYLEFTLEARPEPQE